MELIYLGDSLLKNQVMDSKLISEETNIMGSGYRLSDMGGLLIFLNNNIFFATEWDDKPIMANEVLEALKPKQKSPAEAPSQIITETVEVNSINTESTPDKQKAPEPASEPDTIYSTDLEAEPEGMPKKMSLEEELKIPKYKLPRGWKTVEMFQRPLAAAKQQESNKGGEDLKAASITMETEQEDPAAAKHFFEDYPRIYPFEDNEILICTKIEPKDIGLLPKDLWALSSNSFLMHGFYCYHHLIFAKKKEGESCCYILGIPGIYHNREQFMARMFGFERFKSIRKRDLRQGDFGYWFLPVNF